MRHIPIIAAALILTAASALPASARQLSTNNPAGKAAPPSQRYSEVQRPAAADSATPAPVGSATGEARVTVSMANGEPRGSRAKRQRVYRGVWDY